MTYLAVFFFKPILASQLDGLGEGMAKDKILATACDGASMIDTIARPEPWLVPQLQTKEASEEKKMDHQKRS
jgi:hypothetical protein